jgi:hypothetical protein
VMITRAAVSTTRHTTTPPAKMKSNMTQSFSTATGRAVVEATPPA